MDGQIISPEAGAQPRKRSISCRSDQMELCLVQGWLICKGDFSPQPTSPSPRLRGFQFIYTWIQLLVSVFCSAS